MIKRILVPMIGSDLAEDTFACAFYLARANDASLDLLYAIDITSNPPLIPMAGLLVTSGRLLEKLSLDAKEREREEKERARLVVEGFESQCRREGVEVRSSIAPGYPGEEILRRQRVADLVCMENPSVQVKRRHLRRANLMLARITRLAARPILFLSGPFRPFRRVAVAYDGSPEATKALKAVTEIGGPRPSFEIVLLHVSSDEEEGRAVLREGAEYLEPYDLPVGTRLASGRQGPTILSTARDLDVQLIVMGAFGRNRLRDLLFGSATEYLLSHSEIPLLVTH